MEEMPVLVLGRGAAVLLFLVEPLNLESVEERHRLIARECRDVVLGRPGVAVAEQLTREPASRCDRLVDPAPYVAERVRPAEEQAEACPDEIDAGGKLDVFHPRRDGREASGDRSRDPTANALDRLFLGIDGEYSPAPPEHRQRVDARSASQIDGRTLFARTERVDHLEQHLAGLATLVLVVVLGPLGAGGHRRAS